MQAEATIDTTNVDVVAEGIPASLLIDTAHINDFRVRISSEILR